jgi:hypothetical protein
LLWFYLISNCDSVGVWKEDLELASYIIKCEYTEETVLKTFGDKIKVLPDKQKWWIRDFCKFQYGILQENANNKPHKSYIELLKKHRLYIDYKKTIDSLKDKEREKEKEKEGDSKGGVKLKSKIPVKKKPTKKKLGEYKHVLLTRKEYNSLFDKWGQKKLDYMIKQLDEGIEMKGYSYKNHNLAIQKWALKETGSPDNSKVSVKFNKKRNEATVKYEA